MSTVYPPRQHHPVTPGAQKLGNRLTLVALQLDNPFWGYASSGAVFAQVAASTLSSAAGRWMPLTSVTVLPLRPRRLRSTRTAR